MIQAKVVADSKNEFGNRITTMEVVMPRFILAEFNTHRMFSRNSASSRAIPFKKMVESVKNNPFIPTAWQKDHSGMQGSVYLSKTDKFGLNTFIASLVDILNTFIDKESKEYKALDKEIEEKINLIESVLQKYKFEEKTLDEWWLFARDKAVEVACIMYIFRATKQLANRLLEPFMYHKVLVTATEWENFFALRCPRYDVKDGFVREFRSRKDAIKFSEISSIILTHLKDFDTFDWFNINKGQAEIHMMALAEAMWDAMNESIPKELKAGEWHIPMGDDINKNLLLETCLKLDKPYEKQDEIKIATARCARVSYTVVGEESKEPNYENDIRLHDSLATSGHWSPFEHCARVMDAKEQYDNNYSGNFKGFIQYRKTFQNENITN